jgi:hypothetical protein
MTPSGDGSEALATPSPFASDQPSPSDSQPPSAPKPGASLRVEAFAKVVADRVQVRSLPDRDSEPMMICIGGDSPTPCQPLTIGQETEYTSVYVLEGPVSADGFDWYLAAIESENTLYWEAIGWIAAGDDQDAWLVHTDRECPEAPYELSEVAFRPLSPLSALHCVGGIQLTLRGYYTEDTSGEEPDAECAGEPAWLVCTVGWHTLRLDEGSMWGSFPHLTLHIHPAIDAMPSRPGWIEVTGQFDHPAAAKCGDQPATILSCRVEFVVTSARSVSEP